MSCLCICTEWAGKGCEVIKDSKQPSVAAWRKTRTGVVMNTNLEQRKEEMVNNGPFGAVEVVAERHRDRPKLMRQARFHNSRSLPTLGLLWWLINMVSRDGIWIALLRSLFMSIPPHQDRHAPTGANVSWCRSADFPWTHADVFRWTDSSRLDLMSEFWLTIISNSVIYATLKRIGLDYWIRF